MTTTRTVTSFRAQAIQPDPLTGIFRRFLRMQSGIFNALYELLFVREGLAKAAECDDRESAYERLGFAALERCTCGHGRNATVYFRLADQWDHKERRDGWAPVAVRADEAAAYARGVSTEIEGGRVLVLAARRGKGPGGVA